MNGGNQGTVTTGVSGMARLSATRRSRSLVAVGIAATLSLATVGFALGRDASTLKPRAHTGQAWLATTSSGSVSQVDGLSGSAGAEVPINGAAGHALSVTQSGDLVLVRDTVTGTVTVIDTTHLSAGAQITPGRDTVQVAGGGAVFLVDEEAGQVQKVDPVTLAPLDAVVQLPGKLGAPIVDDAGTLWAPVDSDGSVVPVTAAGRGLAISVAAANADMVMALAGGTPVAVDRNGGTATTLSAAGAGTTIVMPRAVGAGSALQVANVDGSQPLPLLRTGFNAALILVNLANHTPTSVNLPDPFAAHQLQSPVQAGDRTFVPDFTDSGVLVYDRAQGKWWPDEVKVPGGTGSFDTTVQDGIAYFNDPSSPDAVTVTADGVLHQVTKTGPSVPAAASSGSASTAAPRPPAPPQGPPSSAPTSGPTTPKHTPASSAPPTSVPAVPTSVPLPAPTSVPSVPSVPPVSVTSGPKPPPPPTTPPATPPPTSKPSPTATSSPSPSKTSPSPTQTSPTSQPSSSPPPPPAPPVPQGLAASSGNGQVTLQWAAFPNPAAVSTVIIGPPGQGTVNWTPGSTTATVTGLGCQAYTFTIASKGPGGTSAAATFPVAWGCQAPGSGPTNVQVTPSIDATWLVVSWAGVPGATSYDVTANIRTNVQGYQPDSSNHLVSVAGNQTSATVIGLYMGQVYGITVTARNGQGSAASASVSGITGWGPGSSARSVTIDMSSYTNIRACNPGATSGSTMCNAWLMKSPFLWVNNNQPPPLGNEYTALNQHSSISVVCGKQGAKVLGTGGANAATWLLTAGNGYVGWLSDGWIVGAGSTVASLPTCNF